MKLYLIRHGETNWNTQKLLQGKTDIPLNEKGREVARLTAKGLRDVHFDMVYSSPLVRAKETAELVTEGRYQVNTDPRLEEISFGIYEGYCCDKEGYNIPDPDFHYFFEDPSQYKAAEGGENVQDLIDRIKDFLEELAKNPANQDKTILLSTHGASLRAILAVIQRVPLKNFWRSRVQRNCGVTIIDVTEGVFTIEQEDIIYYDEALSINYD